VERSTKRLVLTGLAVVFVFTAGTFWMLSKERVGPEKPGVSAPPAKDHDSVMFAAQGRIEGMNEAIQIGAGVSGLLEAIPFHEGDVVERGQVLARIQCRPAESERGIAFAELEARVAAHERLLRGSRAEERLEAEARTAAAEVSLQRARMHYERVEALFQGAVTPIEDRDQALKDFELAEEQYNGALQREYLVKAGALPEEVAKSRAEIQAAEKHVEQLQRQLDLCIVKAPASGTVLRIFKHAGEAYSTFFPEPILSLEDTSGFRVRAEVDERDVSRVFMGQRAEVVAEALEGKSVAGRVERIGAQMGRKKARTGDPAERSDRDVLEVLVALDDTTTRLVPDLRVTVRFFPSAGK
jgi:HlyD family secretion protein